jgi:tol-pal system protein YbgF
LLLCATLAAGSLSGCASRNEILGFKEDANYIRAQLDTLNLNLQNLRMQVDGLQIRQERLVEEMVTQSDFRQYKAYLGSRLDDYEAQSLMISAQINDLSQRLTGVVQQMDQLRYQPPAVPTVQDSVDTGAVSIAGSIELKELYDQAYNDLTRGNYELAKMGFQEYLRLYPDTELADNALYWMGETDYVQHRYEEALKAFQRVLKEYPTGNKVPAALFKIGLCQTALSREDEAKAAFETLVRDYPATPEAAQAKQRLEEMK